MLRIQQAAQHLQALLLRGPAAWESTSTTLGGAAVSTAVNGSDTMVLRDATAVWQHMSLCDQRQQASSHATDRLLNCY